MKLQGLSDKAINRVAQSFKQPKKVQEEDIGTMSAEAVAAGQKAFVDAIVSQISSSEVAEDVVAYLESANLDDMTDVMIEGIVRGFEEKGI